MRVQCAACSGVQDNWVCQLHMCVDCALGQLDTPGVGKELLENLRRVESRLTREGTWKVHKRGIACYRAFAGPLGWELPATEMQVLAWMSHCVTKENPLDGSTVDAYKAGVSCFHEQARVATGGEVRNPVKTGRARLAFRTIAREYKLEEKKVRALTQAEWLGILGCFPKGSVGDHHKLVAMVSALGPFRPSAAGAVTVTYTVMQGKVGFGKDSHVKVVEGDPRYGGWYLRMRSFCDTNVRRNQVREVPIPGRCMGMEPVKFVSWYLLTCRPPSGDYLLAAPHGKNGWYKSRYTGSGSALRSAYARAFPRMAAHKLGAASWRESFPQWLERAGRTDTEVTDICGWSRKGLKARVGTKAAYTITELDMQLRIKAGLERRLRKECERRV
jgi:hypothetical protein